MEAAAEPPSAVEAAAEPPSAVEAAAETLRRPSAMEAAADCPLVCGQRTVTTSNNCSATLGVVCVFVCFPHWVGTDTKFIPPHHSQTSPRRPQVRATGSTPPVRFVRHLTTPTTPTTPTASHPASHQLRGACCPPADRVPGGHRAPWSWVRPQFLPGAGAAAGFTTYSLPHSPTPYSSPAPHPQRRHHRLR